MIPGTGNARSRANSRSGVSAVNAYVPRICTKDAEQGRIASGMKTMQEPTGNANTARPSSSWVVQHALAS